MQYFYLLSLSLLLSGCGGGSNSSSSDANPYPRQSHAPQIINFGVVGSGSSTDETTPIDGSIDKGKFELNWKTKLDSVEGNYLDSFSIDIYLSEDAVLSADDMSIYHDICKGQKCLGVTATKALCEFKYSDYLGNSDAYSIWCKSGTGIGAATSMNTFIDRLPKKANLILVAHGSILNKPNKHSQKIELR